MQRAALAMRRLIHPLSLRANPIRVKIREDIQLRIQTFDLPDMRLGQFDRRNPSAAQKVKLFYRRRKHKIVQG